MYLDNETLDVLPQAGRLVCFRSEQIEHEVLPATRPRFSITGWILDQLVGLKHL
jgi:SM-20-related protein